ncbi:MULTISPECIES: major capsid protein [unclassified Pseudomonas]|uniref:major capsid protein n=1 Tax=unclassified Pseudomonas TaxID=196821 RepID=UPI002446D8DE|nr:MULTISPECIES: major capsid protein [unclassified Pseudomonas]MDG9931021.1 major capsid protein [Pseudomonas sp. GD04042]MDH0485387.1 major capsid protein [Pseudomonas sp. GD04015]MDH0605078.1 major capsid protein [Pseudomonas sp. GD03869]
MQKLQVLRRSLGATAAVGLLSVQQVHAALGTDITTALSTAKVDGVELAGIVLAVIIAIAAFKFMRKAL